MDHKMDPEKYPARLILFIFLIDRPLHNGGQRKDNIILKLSLFLIPQPLISSIHQLEEVYHPGLMSLFWYLKNKQYQCWHKKCNICFETVCFNIPLAYKAGGDSRITVEYGGNDHSKCTAPWLGITHSEEIIHIVQLGPSFKPESKVWIKAEL